jgi:hypothetical protein
MTIEELLRKTPPPPRQFGQLDDAGRGAYLMQHLFGLGPGAGVHAVGQGGSLRPQTSAEIAHDFYGLGDGGHPQTARPAPMFQPAAPIPQYFGNDWSGMRRNIGMYPQSTGLAGLGGLGAAVGGALGGAQGPGLPQRSLFGGGIGGGSSLGQLLQMLGGGR